MKRLINRALLLTVGLLASMVTLVGVGTSPASATDYETAPWLQLSKSDLNKKVVLHGASLTFKVGVNTVVGGTTYYLDFGTVELQRRNYGQTGWSTIWTTTLTETNHQPTWSYRPSASAAYRLHYVGATSGSDTLKEGYSSAVVSHVARNLHDNFRRATRKYYGKVTPSYGHRTVYLQKSRCSAPTSSSCRWATYASVRTSSTGVWAVKLPVYSRRTHFRAVVKASNGYVTSLSNYYVDTWRG